MSWMCDVSVMCGRNEIQGTQSKGILARSIAIAGRPAGASIHWNSFIQAAPLPSRPPPLPSSLPTPVPPPPPRPPPLSCLPPPLARVAVDDSSRVFVRCSSVPITLNAESMF
eukprot:scaffold11049_cov96-Isochrysis_galbana.AAC.4